MNDMPRFGTAGLSDSFKASGGKTPADIARFTAGFGLTAFEYQCGRGVRISAEPSPLLTILPTGQPILMSIMSAWHISSARLAPSAILSGSWPKICAATGRPCCGMCSSAAVFLSL